MKKLMTIVTVFVLLVSFAAGAIGAVDLQKKPPDAGPDTGSCYYVCVQYDNYYERLYCCPRGNGVVCELEALVFGGVCG